MMEGVNLQARKIFKHKLSSFGWDYCKRDDQAVKARAYLKLFCAGLTRNKVLKIIFDRNWIPSLHSVARIQ
jgi:hypothetical protein